MRRLGLASIAAVLLLGAAVAVAAETPAPENFKVGNLDVEIEGGITPTKLPRNEKAPITLQVGGAIKTDDGSHPAALKSLQLEFDKNGELNTTGLPTCTDATTSGSAGPSSTTTGTRGSITSTRSTVTTAPLLVLAAWPAVDRLEPARYFTP